MEETSKNKKGFLLISSLIVLTTMIMIVSFYLSETLKEIKISKIVDTSLQAYYLSEAGIQEAFWKLQNDPEYKNNFETNPNWSASFTRIDSIIPDGSYTVTIENNNLAQATITSTSTISIYGTQAQRVVKAGVFKALNENPVEGVSVFSNGEIKSIASRMQISGGDFFSNSNINLKLFSEFSTDADAKAVKKIKKDLTSTMRASGEYDEDNPPSPEEIITPQIDFDSSDAGSLKSNADYVYTKNEFKNLMDNNPDLQITGIVYITGDVTIKKGHSVTIYGALVSDGSIAVGNGFSIDPGAAQLKVYKSEEGSPSGIYSKKNITLGGFSINVYIEGIIYAGGTLKIQDGIFENVDVAVEGGVIAQDIDTFVSWNPITITHNQQYINDALGAPLFSQVLFINHWEEEY